MADLIDWTRSTLLMVLETARSATAGPWEGVVDDHGRGEVDASVWSDALGYYTEKISSGDRHREDAAHIGLNDPRATIARCEADLAALDEHRPEGHYAYRDDGTLSCGTCGDYTVEWPCRTVRLVAWGLRFHAPGYPGSEEMP